jgi:outer membrane immunogenic protein
MTFAKIAFGIASLTVASLPAAAADLPMKAPPMAVAASYWNNCYVGANGGWKWGRFNDSADVPVTTGTIGAGTFTAVADRIDLGSSNANSGAFGGQIGCRWQTPSNWVFGLEGDFDWTNVRSTVVSAGIGTGRTFVPGDSFTDRLRWESTIRGVIGYAWDRWMIYGTGGLALGGVSMDANFIATTGTLTNGAPGLYPGSAGSDTKTLVGATVGAGFAYAFARNWEFGAEYRFTAYQRGDFAVGQVAALCGPTSVVAVAISCFSQNATGHKDLTTSEILFKLNYRFDWGGPVVAKY